jgi:hypothetical protein
VEYAAFRTSLASSVAARLEELGYGLLDELPFGLEEQVITWRMSVPDGEQIRVQLELDGTIGFRLLHEIETAGVVQGCRQGVATTF